MSWGGQEGLWMHKATPLQATLLANLNSDKAAETGGHQEFIWCLFR